jgi:dinuclear metal center YbgI/SA1388 family protein
MNESMFVREVLSLLDEWFPASLAEDWDNVGLLLGDPRAPLHSIMTCLTVTDESADEAIVEKADLIVSHHPILFRPVQRLTADGPQGAVYRLARAGVAVYSPHTCFDGAEEGINGQIARRLGLAEVRPLRRLDEDNPLAGAGRIGELPTPMSLGELALRARGAFGAPQIEYVGDAARTCRRVAIGCGAGAEFLGDAAAAGCDVLVTGEARFHQLLEATQRGTALILAGHYATERFAVETLAERLSAAQPSLRVWASKRERDPIQRL